jgi:hypothetical protein
MPYFVAATKNLVQKVQKEDQRELIKYIKYRMNAADFNLRFYCKTRVSNLALMSLRREIKALQGLIVCRYPKPLVHLDKALSRNCLNLTKLSLNLCLFKANYTKQQIIELALKIQQLKHLTELSLTLTELRQSLDPKVCLNLFAAIKSLRQLTSLALFFDEGQHKHVATVVSCITRLSQLTVFKIKFPMLGTMIDQLPMHIGELTQITTLGLDLSFCNTGVNVIQDLIANFKQLPQLTQVDLKFSFGPHDNTIKAEERPQWLSLLASAIQQLPLVTILNIDLGPDCNWNESKSLLLQIYSHQPVEQINLYLHDSYRLDISKAKEEAPNLLPGFLITIKEKNSEKSAENKGRMLVAKRKH